MLQSYVPCTTADRGFAERLRRSAKANLRSAKALPSATLDEGLIAKKRSAKAPLPSVICRALGKAFAERQGGVRQRKVAIITVSHRDTFFA